jgi:prolactin regulatory element-binding protein
MMYVLVIVMLKSRIHTSRFQFTVLQFPSLDPIALSTQACKDKALIYDAAFSLDNSHLVVATTNSLLVYSIPESGKGKEKESSGLSLVKTIPVPSFPGGATGSFRAAKFHPTDSNVLYTVVNTSAPPPNPKKSKAPVRRAFIYKWDPNTWEHTLERKIDKSISAFDIRYGARVVSHELF